MTMGPASGRFLLHPQQPFAFDTILASLRRSPGTVLERVTQASYRRAVELAGAPVLLSVEPAHNGAAALRVEVTGAAALPAVEPAARTLAAHLFQTAVDVSGIDAIDDPVFQAAWARCRGFRPVQLPTVWEALVWAIIGQQINVAFAARCKRAFTGRYGGVLELDGVAYPLFPTPEAVAPLAEADLQALQFSRQKARYVLSLARAIVEGRFDPEALHGVPGDEAVQRLTTLTGVGRWTAEYVLLRGLGYPDALPAGDVALQRAVGRAYGLGRPATEAEVRAYGERWAPFRSYATIAWWFSNTAQLAQAMP